MRGIIPQVTRVRDAMNEPPNPSMDVLEIRHLVLRHLGPRQHCTRLAVLLRGSRTLLNGTFLVNNRHTVDNGGINERTIISISILIQSVDTVQSLLPAQSG